MQYVTRENIIKVLKGLNLNIKIEHLDPSKDLLPQNVDSLDMMNILFGLEEVFSIKISDDSIDAGQWLTIDDMVRNVNKLLGQKGIST